MKRNFIFTLATLFTLFLLTSCEKADVNLAEKNIETKLNSMLGLEISAMSNLLKSEDYNRIKLDNIYSFIGDNDTYTLIINTKSPKTIYSAGYQRADKSDKLSTDYNTYRASFTQKENCNYTATIAAYNFVDLEKGYTDSIKIGVDELGSNIYQYEYDNPIIFYTVLTTNLKNIISSSEIWWIGEKKYNDKVWSLQYNENYNSEKITLGIICADYSMKK